MSSAEKTLEEKVSEIFSRLHIADNEDLRRLGEILALIKAESTASAKREKELAGMLEALRDHDEDKTPLCSTCKGSREFVIKKLGAASDGEGAT